MKTMRDNTKSITIGGRISEPDHEFLMEFPLAGKVTVSEKLRHICTFFRQYHTNLEGYSNCLEQINIMLRPAVNDIKEMENQEGVHSELVTKLLTMVPELLAFLVTQRRPEGQTNQRGQDLKHLHELESRLFESALTFIEGVLRMGLTQKSPTYNPNLLNGKLSTIQELCELLDSRNEPTKASTT